MILLHIDEMPHGIRNFDFHAHPSGGTFTKPFISTPNRDFGRVGQHVLRIRDVNGYCVSDAFKDGDAGMEEAQQFLMDLANARYP